ncbi:MAG TPA: hypothetical protein DCM14_06125, partial [Clostridiales bacterium UBA8153]|nr:hypothetical protein [Clostridiales bacterium UBA8153]
MTLSVETIPGHSGLLPGLVKACPLATYTADTQWAALDGSWAQLYALVPKITNVHVQTYVDEEGAIDHTADVQDVVANTATRSGTPAWAGRAA